MRVRATRIYTEIQTAINEGYTTVSAQGSSRSSKTYNILIWLIIYCLQHSGTRLSIVRATLPAIKGSVFIDFKEILINMGIFNEKSLNKTELTYQFDNGSWVEFFSTDSEQKLRGRKRDILYVNEANEIAYIEWRQMKMRTTKFAILDYNPSFSETHWINDLNNDERTYHFISTYKDNPFLEQTIIDEIESLKEKDPNLWRVYGLGLRGIVEGLIYPNWQQGEMPNNLPVWYGVDWGWQPDPTAVVAVCYDPKGQRLFIQEVMYRQEASTIMVAEAIKKHYRNKETWLYSDNNNEILYQNGIVINGVRYESESRELASKLQVICNDAETRRIYREVKFIESASVVAYCDTNAPDRIDDLKRFGIDARKARKGANSVVEQINWIKTNLKVYYQGANIGREVKMYLHKRDKKDERVYLPEPEGGNDHTLDAIRYGAYSGLMDSAITFKSIKENNKLI